MLTDIKTGACFPTQHPLHPFPPSLYVSGAATKVIRDADVILSLDWIDLGGTLLQASGGELPHAKIVQCSVDQYVHHGWNADYQALPPTDVSILASPDSLVAALLAELRPRSEKPGKSWFVKEAETAGANNEQRPAAGQRMPLGEMARVTTETLAPHNPSYIRLPLGWLVQSRYNPSLIAPRVSAPALFLLAEKDDVTPVKNGLALARRWGGSVKTVLLPGVGHTGLEHREEFWGTVGAYLAALDDRGLATAASAAGSSTSR